MPDRKLLLADREAMNAIVAGYAALLPVPRNCEPKLAGVVTDTCTNPGSLTRAQLAYGMLRAFNGSVADAVKVAAIVEYYHTASLILDDLPCMDDADKRRGKPCVHKTYDESAAILGSLAFINRAYFLLAGLVSSLGMEDQERVRFLVDGCLGLDGVLQGQSLDLHASFVNSQAIVEKIATGKTVTLLRLSLVLPALLGGAEAKLISDLDQLALAWGLAYQLIDDFKDVMETDGGKTPGRDLLFQRPNMLLCCGQDEARQILASHFHKTTQILASLSGGQWDFLHRMQNRLLEERDRFVLPAAA